MQRLIQQVYTLFLLTLLPALRFLFLFKANNIFPPQRTMSSSVSFRDWVYPKSYAYNAKTTHPTTDNVVSFRDVLALPPRIILTIDKGNNDYLFCRSELSKMLYIFENMLMYTRRFLLFLLLAGSMLKQVQCRSPLHNGFSN